MRTYLSSYHSKLFAGDLAAFGGPATDEAVAGHIRAEQISLVLGYSLGIMLANACNATVLAIALWHSPNRNYALIWAAADVCGALSIGLKARLSRRLGSRSSSPDRPCIGWCEMHSFLGPPGDRSGGFLRRRLQWWPTRDHMSLLRDARGRSIRLRYDSRGGGCIHGSDFRGDGNLPRQKRRFRLSARRYPRCGLWPAFSPILSNSRSAPLLDWRPKRGSGGIP